MSSEGLASYWKWISSLSPAVQKAHTDNWDETGRPKTVYPVRDAVISLLSVSKNYGEFKAMYYELFTNAQGPGVVCIMDDEYVNTMKCEDDCLMYWRIYYAGLNRVVDEMRK